jgi:hypothetical protein
MVRVVEFTSSTQHKLSKDWMFSRFIDNSMLDFKRNKYNHAAYYYPGGTLIVTKSDNNIIADWMPTSIKEESI